MLDFASRLARGTALVLLACPLSGCLLMTYKPPTQGPMAQMAIVNDTGRLMAVHLYEEPEDCRRRQTLMPITRPGQTRDITVQADKTLTMTLSQDVSANMGCIATFTFQPQAGRSYRARFMVGVGACYVDLSETGSDRKVAFRKREWHTALDENGPFCSGS